MLGTVKAGDVVTSKGGCTRCFGNKFKITGKPMWDGRYPAACVGCGAAFGLDKKEIR